MYVQFSDNTETTIVSVFANPQDPETFPNQGTVEETDARYVAFLAQFKAEINQPLT